MKKKFPNQKWNFKSAIAEKVKELIIKNGGIEDKQVKGKYESWRIKLLDATFTYYKSGTLFCTGTDKVEIKNIWQQIDGLSGARYIPSKKDFLIGLDETGKGEVLGPTILVGSLLTKEIFAEAEQLVGTSDSKSKRTLAYWNEVKNRMEIFKKDGFTYIVDNISPEHIDRFNINMIMDVVYRRILTNLIKQIDVSRVRIAIDDYGVGERLRSYLEHLKNAGAEIIVAQKADEKYLEAKIASLIAKREREKIMNTIEKSKEYQIKGYPIGSGNPGDEKTLKWLKAWKSTGKAWPWFVKQSFKTIRDIDGKTEKVKKENPNIREDILCDEFKKECEAGRFSITNLSIVCPTYGSIRKTSLITIKKGETQGRCAYCNSPIDNLNLTLRYYCGSMLPDSNIILNGLISQDLEHTRFFEGFNILIHPLVKRESDKLYGKKELERLRKYADREIIRLIDLEEEREVKMSIVLDKSEQFKEAVLKFNAIIISDDLDIIKSAQRHNFYCLYI